MALVAGVLLAWASPAGAVIRAVPNTTDGAVLAVQAIAGPGFTGGKSGSFIPLAPTGANPVGIGDATSNLAPFPRSGSPTFLVLSTGDATQGDQPDQPGTFPSVDDGGQTFRGRGDTALDITVLQIPFPSPGAEAPVAACLSFDFRFLSEEYPGRLGSPFNDAFIAELDASPWTTVGPSISALSNFASSPLGQPLTIKSTGVAAMSPTEAVGTPYGAATVPLRAQILVPAVQDASTHTLYLSIFDHGDHAYDSAAFIDNLTLTTPPGDCPTGLTSLGPAVAITGPTIGATVNTPTPTLTGTASGPGDVTVRIYTGSLAAGAALHTLPAGRSGDSWSVVAPALAPGVYTAQATQDAGQGIHAVSVPATFTVPQPQSQSAPSQQQAVGDRDGDGIPDNLDDNDGSRPPVPGKSVQVRVVSGDVFIKYPAGKGPRAVTPPKGFVPLKGAANVPVGSQLDTSKGRVALTSAADTGGAKTQTSDFYQGIFQVKQALPKKKPKKPAALITDLVLKGQIARSECAPLKGARAAAATKKKKGAKAVLGQLWGNGKGKFRTTGKYSSATVRGTIWLTQDRCDGTLTKVRRGTVQVADFKRKKTVTVKAGHSYLARAQRATGKAQGRPK